MKLYRRLVVVKDSLKELCQESYDQIFRHPFLCFDYSSSELLATMNRKLTCAKNTWPSIFRDVSRSQWTGPAENFWGNGDGVTWHTCLINTLNPNTYKSDVQLTSRQFLLGWALTHVNKYCNTVLCTCVIITCLKRPRSYCLRSYHQGHIRGFVPTYFL